MPRRRAITRSRQPAITITRHGLKQEKVVYIAVANRPQRYPFARSPIVYIGTTKTGVRRIAVSAANKAQRFLQSHGVKQLDFYVVSCKPLQRVETWKKLESALLLTFKFTYGRVPVGNTALKNKAYRDELQYFTERRLRAILQSFTA